MPHEVAREHSLLIHKSTIFVLSLYLLYYTFIAAEEKGLGIQDLMDADEEVVGEKLQSEIEKFRMRQKIRDV